MNTFTTPRPTSTDISLADPPKDSISRIKFSPVANGVNNLLAVSSWDKTVRFYNINEQGQSSGMITRDHSAPVLDVAWSDDGSQLVAAGCDNMAVKYDMTTLQQQQVAQHDAPIKCCQFVTIQGQNVLATAGWDNMLKYWDVRSPPSAPMDTIDLGQRAYSMDANNDLMVVATANRHVHIIDPRQGPRPKPPVESPLKWQTRVVACFPTGYTYAIGSIEGRVGIQYPMEPDDKKNYSFKCHRYEIVNDTPSAKILPAGSPFSSGQSQHVFSVNSITFHKSFGTFCTGGSDGSITFWDGIGRTKVKAFSLKELNNGTAEQTATPTAATNPSAPYTFGVPVVSTAFNHNQGIFAYALSYDWSKGHGGAPQPNENPTKVMLHQVKPDEVKKKK